MTLTPHEYWNYIGSTKEFEDPLYLDKLSQFLSPNSVIIEYGCGYGRLMHHLKIHGYDNLMGFDFAQRMIERGKTRYPDLNLQLLEKSGKIPLEKESVDAVIMSTVLCCMVDDSEQIQLIEEIYRILKAKGVIYLSDFLICHHQRYKSRYSTGHEKFGRWGIYTTDENLVVRHLTSQDVLKLLKCFDIHWFEQFDFKTMNNNPARTFHCIALK